MSSIIITSRLHTAWSRSTKEWAREMRRSVGTDGGFHSIAPRPSEEEPAPEEFSNVLRAVLPFGGRGINHTTISAIVAAAMANLGNFPDTAMLPLAYHSGLQSVSVHGRNVALSYGRELIGAPLVPLEDFPLSRYYTVGEMPSLIEPFPSEMIGKILFTAWRGMTFYPKVFNRISDLPEDEIRLVHARELERVPAAPGVFFKPTVSNLRYTGCVRPATDAEIDALFQTTLLPDRWLKMEDFSFRDFFSGMGMDARSWTEAADLAEATLRANTPVSASTATDVRPATSPRRRSRDVEAQSLPRSTPISANTIAPLPSPYSGDIVFEDTPPILQTGQYQTPTPEPSQFRPASTGVPSTLRPPRFEWAASSAIPEEINSSGHI